MICDVTEKMNDEQKIIYQKCSNMNTHIIPGSCDLIEHRDNINSYDDFHQQQIKSLYRKIDILTKRLNDTKSFCDSLWEQLKEYEQ